VDHSPVTAYTPGSDLDISASVSDDEGVGKVLLRYRAFGELAYREREMKVGGGGSASAKDGTYEGVIPGEAVTASGVEYFIEAVDNQGIGNSSGNLDEPNRSLFPAPPVEVRARTSSGEEITLNWPAPSETGLSEYRVYRDVAPIDTSEGAPSGLSPVGSVAASSTTFTDAPETGDTYYYRVTAVDTAGEESAVSVQEQVFLYPQEVSASASRTFGGAADSTNYRLVALPGQVDRPLADVVGGEAGTEWQAYFDDGSDSDFLVRFGESDAFRFRPGNGFWLTATSGWTSSAQAATVSLRGDSAATIGLRDGWNVISNPTDKDVAWSRVEATTSGALQALWGFDGAFAEADTFRSAQDGVAYYFFNDEASRDSLVIPYPGAPNVGGKAAPKAAEEAPLLAISASPTRATSTAASTVRIGLDETAVRGVGPEDLIAPPGRFAATSLRIEAPGDPSSKRARFLMAERRPAAEDGGHTFRLRLTSRVDGPVQLRAENLRAVEGQSVALLRPSAGTTHDLREEPAVTIDPDGPATTMKVAVGTEEYVQSKTETVLPEKVRLTSYPNPIGQQGTIEYALPEERKVTLRVYDVLGREVATLETGRKKAGRHTIQLETDRLSSGVYFGRLQAGDQTLTQKITVVR
jgi:hypothetical protein